MTKESEKRIVKTNRDMAPSSLIREKTSSEFQTGKYNASPPSRQQFSYHQSGMTNKSFLLEMVVTSWFPWHHPQVKHSATYKAWLHYWKSLLASFHGDQISRVNDLSDLQIWADERTQCLVWTNCQRHAQR